MNPYLLQKLMDWGVVIPREENGDMRIIPTGPMTAMICVDLDITLRVRRTAEKLGVRFMDKTAMADILVTDEIESFKILAGYLDGAVIDEKTVNELADIPSKETLVAKFLGSIQSPLYGLAYALQAIADKQQEAPAAE